MLTFPPLLPGSHLLVIVKLCAQEEGHMLTETEVERVYPSFVFALVGSVFRKLLRTPFYCCSRCLFGNLYFYST